jgi:hypothetical protein
MLFGPEPLLRFLLFLGVFAPWRETKRPASSQDRADGKAVKENLTPSSQRRKEKRSCRAIA